MIFKITSHRPPQSVLQGETETVIVLAPLPLDEEGTIQQTLLHGEVGTAITLVPPPADEGGLIHFVVVWVIGVWIAVALLCALAVLLK